MKQKSWISIVFSFASQCRGKIALSVLCAIISVVAGLIPYWSVYQIITLFIGGSPVMAEVWKWCWIGLGAYAIRFLLYGISTSLSHISAYTILENIRLTLAQRLMKAPLGTVIGESVGKLKSVLVDRVETIELPLAHMIPECISNLLLPMAVFAYLVCFDCDRTLSIHDLEARLHQGKLSFASPERMMRYLGLEPGSVSPFGLINDAEHHVHLFLDRNLLYCPSLSFHPNDCRATVVIARTEFERYLARVGNSYEYLDLYEE